MSEQQAEEPTIAAPRLGAAANPSRAEIDSIIARWLGRSVAIQGVRQLTGGLMCTILEVTFDGRESPVVLKVSGDVNDLYLARQAEATRYTLRHTGFPLPELFEHDISGELAPYSYMLMERVPGRHLGEVKESMSEEEHTRLLEDMADFVADMHSHQVERYGMIASDESWACWVERTAASLGEWHDKLADKLSEEGRGRLRRLIDALPEHLEGTGPPCLVHGDIWAPNIMVHEGRLRCFLDPDGLFSPAERDLADLEIWGTVDHRFMDRYREHHPDDGGYERRRRVHWLGAVLLHTDIFGEGYTTWAENLLTEMTG